MFKYKHIILTAFEIYFDIIVIILALKENFIHSAFINNHPFLLNPSEDMKLQVRI